MPKFRKKPVIIEARQVPTPPPDGGAIEGPGIVEYVEACVALAEWCGGRSYAMHSGNEPNYYYPGDPGTDHIIIPTKEGDMRADVGDWIIRGVAGEFYPCKHSIFLQTYDPVWEAGQEHPRAAGETSEAP